MSSETGPAGWRARWPMTWMPQAGDEAAYRWAVASRVIAAVVVGYLLVSLFTALLGLVLPGPRAEAVLTATMLSFSVYTGVVIWVFTAGSAAQVWRGLLGALGVVGAALLAAQRLLA